MSPKQKISWPIYDTLASHPKIMFTEAEAQRWKLDHHIIHQASAADHRRELLRLEL